MRWKSRCDRVELASSLRLAPSSVRSYPGRHVAGASDRRIMSSLLRGLRVTAGQSNPVLSLHYIKIAAPPADAWVFVGSMTTSQSLVSYNFHSLLHLFMFLLSLDIVPKCQCSGYPSSETRTLSEYDKGKAAFRPLSLSIDTRLVCCEAFAPGGGRYLSSQTPFFG
jgi:hypothetical protein